MLDIQPKLVAQGAQLYEQLNCAACHSIGESHPRNQKRSDFVIDPDAFLAPGGCLAPDANAGPHYALDEDQRSAIAVALKAPREEPTDQQRIARTLTAFNCIACHERDGYGGVRPEVNAYFATNEHDLGDDARVPPSLTLVGAKLQGPWLRKVLFENGNLRDYMFTRMPSFGQANLAHLPELLERADEGKIEPFPMPLPKGEAAGTARDAGRQLTGIRGLGCISCHDFQSIPSPIHEGIDLIGSNERLQPSWFARFLLDPQAFSPGIVMPQSWPGGVASHPGILEGDTEAQIQALWFYLSEGRTARIPEGIRPEPSSLEVTDTTRTYRGRSRVAGFRGIAVGFPGGLSYAFDAQNGTLAALWQGDFVSVRWDGQGAGDFDPLARSIPLGRDVSFVRLPDPDAPWPRRPYMDEENPINPDPFYPRNHGYRFLGYALDADFVPTLRYASGELVIEDKSEADMSGERPVLRRTLRFDQPSPEGLYLRVLEGDIEAIAPLVYEIPGLRVNLAAGSASLRPYPEADPAFELVLSLPAGSTSLSIDYELLD